MSDSRFTKCIRGMCAGSLYLMCLVCWLMLSTDIIHATPSDRVVDEPESRGFTLYLPSLYQTNYHDYRTPSAPYPTDKATDVSINTFLRWNDDLLTLPDETSPFQFEVFLAAGNRPSSQPIARLARNALDTRTLMPHTHYTWQVVSIDGEGNRFFGPEWSFQTLAVDDDSSEIPNPNAMVAVPAGEFMMGCDPNNPYDDSDLPCTDGTGVASVPLHTVYLNAFVIDKYEVSNLAYEQCVDSQACNRPRRPPEDRLERYGNDEYASYPVVYISRDDAQDYCAWRGKRLPTEAEWEKAARGSIDTRAWPWGQENFSCDRMNYGPDDKCPGWVMDPVRVALHPRGMSPYGALDMAGNVNEWVHDRFDRTYYSWTPYANPQGSDVSRVFSTSLDNPNDDFAWPTYVLRGGDFWGRFYYHHVHYRYFGHWGEGPHIDDIPYFRNRRTGFRCARSVK